MQRRWQVLTLVSVATFVASLDLFIVNIAFPDIRADFGGASVGALSWVLNAYAIVFAALLVPAGRLADRAGRRRGFLGGPAAVRARLGAVRARAVGRGCSWPRASCRPPARRCCVPTSLALLLPEFEPRERPAAIGIWAGVGARGRGGRPAARRPARRRSTGGCVFLVNLPVGAWALWRGARLLTETRDETAQARPDWLGAVLLAASIGALTLGFVQAPEWGWGDARTLGALAAAAARPRRCSRCAARATPRRSSTRRCCASARSRWPTSPRSCSRPRSAAMLLSNVLFQTGVWHESILRAGLQLAPGPALAADHRGRLEPAHQPRRAAQPDRPRLHAVRARHGHRARARRHDARLGERAAAGPDPHRHRRRPDAAEPQQRRRGVAAARALRDRRGGGDDVAPARDRARRGDPRRRCSARPRRPTCWAPSRPAGRSRSSPRCSARSRASAIGAVGPAVSPLPAVPRGTVAGTQTG